MNQLERGQLAIWRIQACGLAVAGYFAAAIAELIRAKAGLPLPAGAIGALVAIISLYVIFLAPGRHYRAWSWRLEGDELHLHRGVWTKVETIVPFRRVQHIDVSQNGVENAFHVTRLVLHTAGTVAHRIVLPGLSRDTAKAIRDQIRAAVGRESDDD